MKITPDLISRLVREEVQAIYREEEEEHQDEKGSDDEVQRADDQGMKKNVEVAAKFMFKHPQLSKALGKMVGDKVESAQLLSLLAQELGIEPNEISSIMSKVKKNVNKGADQEEEAAADAKKAGGDEEGLKESVGDPSQHIQDIKKSLRIVWQNGDRLASMPGTLENPSDFGESVKKHALVIHRAMKELEPMLQGGAGEGLEEGRYKRSPYQGEDPRAQAFDEAINILDDQVYDSLEGDVAAYVDEAVRALSKAIDELEYQRNTVGNLGDAEKQAISDYEANQGK